MSALNLTMVSPLAVYLDEISDSRLAPRPATLDGKVLGWLGGTGKTLKKFGWIHEIACPAENELYVAEVLNWRAQKLTLHP